ncbi:MAG: hypothetical protein H6546_03735 [Chitinophagales bacterium]|nr:hypothetical protein [Chitinophagales bacterium]MCB9312565.1 hypothetical protein [Lewinellaceae bacterium]
MSAFNPNIPPEGTRVIRTARTLEDINQAAREGFRPLVRPIQPSPRIYNKVSVYQHRQTGEIDEFGDYRYIPDPAVWEEVLPWTHYYPYQWPRPYAAYLLPPDLETGDTVWLEDLIEDVIAAVWNQGNAWRLDSCLAVWNGEEFDLLYDEGRDRRVMMG